MENNINELSIVEYVDILIDNMKNYGTGDVEFSIKTKEFKISSKIYNECTVSKNNIDADTFKSLLHLVKLHNDMKILLTYLVITLVGGAILVSLKARSAKLSRERKRSKLFL